jgi:hypothetical protein
MPWRVGRDDSPQGMACPEGLEPPTYSLEGYCSIQLSYGQQTGPGREGLRN